MTERDSALAGLDAASAARVRATLGVRPRGLFTDVDGTISAIAPAPDAAVLLPGVAEALAEACAVFDVVAAVSGRSAVDTRRLVGVPGLTYIGNHGFERLDPTAAASDTSDDTPHVLPAAEPYVATVNTALDDVEDTLAMRYPGLLVERKGVTGSIHVRATSDPAAAEEAAYLALSTIAVARGLRVTRGKLVVEVRPPVEVDKGVAITDVIRARGLRAAIYLGDDRTDIDAFRALRRLTEDGVCAGVAVAVLHAEAPAGLADAADVTLASAERVPAFLRWLLTSL